MKRIGIRTIVAWALLLPALLSSGVVASEAADLADRPGDVFVVPVQGTIDLGLAAFVRRAVDEAAAARAAVIVLEMNTFGGRVDAATEIRDAFLASGIPTAAFIKERAWSAGALIALGADSIWMAPGSSMGAAEPRPADAKTVSALRAEFEAMAERAGRDPKIAAAMVDPAVTVEGLDGPESILTLTPQAAVDHGYAEGVVASRSELLAELGLSGRNVVSPEPNWAERVARIITEPTISQLLLTLGFLGLIAEVTSPGLGVPGAAGLAALLLFFGGRLVVGIAGWEAPLLFFAGIVLLLVELFALPGFGVAGVGGLAAVFAGIALAFDSPAEAVRGAGIALLITLVGLVLLWRFGRLSAVWQRLVLGTRLEGESGYVAAADRSALVGKEGRSLTALRPAGAVEIAGERVDAVSEGGYIEAGAAVRAVLVEGTRIVVRRIQREAE